MISNTLTLCFTILLHFTLTRIVEGVPKAQPTYAPLTCQKDHTEGSFDLKYTVNEEEDFETMDLKAELNLYANSDAIADNAVTKTPIDFSDGKPAATKTMTLKATTATPAPWKFETKKLSNDFVVQPFLSYSAAQGAQAKAELRFIYGQQNFTSPNNKGNCQFGGGTLSGPSNLKVTCYKTIGDSGWWLRFTGNFCYLTSDLKGS